MMKAWTRMALGILAFGALTGGAEAITLPPGEVVFHFSGLDSGAVYGGSCVTVGGCDAAQIAPGTPIGGGGTAGVLPTAGPGFVAGEDSWGIFRVSTITDANLNIVWSSGQGGEFLTGIFYNSQDFQVIFDPVTGVQTTQSTGIAGGSILIDVYVDDDPGIFGLPGIRTGADSYPTMTDGTLWLSLATVAGSDASVPTAHLTGTFNTNTGTGGSHMFADVTGGAFAGSIEPGTQTTNIGTPADFSFEFDIVACTNQAPGLCPPGAGWTAGFNDPAVTSIVAQPLTVVLLGSALAGMGGVGYIRRRRA
jgi:hypothetical protein